MLASERLLMIEGEFGQKVRSIVPLEMDGETLQLTLFLNDGTNVRIAEQWRGESLERYSYYWLTATNALKIGWDNAPHHSRLQNSPHHKHVGSQKNRQPSYETSLREVMAVILHEH